MDETDAIQAFVAPPDVAGQTLERFLGDVLPLEPQEVVRELLRLGLVTVNDEMGRAGTRLRAGDRITVRDRAATRKGLELEVVRPAMLYQDEHVVVVDKPAGVPVTAERSGGGSPLLRGVLEVLAKSELGPQIVARRYRPRTVHRLDRDTTGTLIFSISAEGEFELKRQFQERTIQKEYLVVVHGEVSRDEGEITGPVAEDARDVRRVRLDSRAGKPAETRYRVLERFRGFTLLEVRPVTGRRHQIRVHLASIGHPVVGDLAYGGALPMLSRIKRGYKQKRDREEKPLIGRAAVHSFGVTFTPVGRPGSVRVEAPVPRDMAVLLKMLRKYARGGGGELDA